MSAREAGTELANGYNFAYLDEQTKRMIRRAHAQSRGRARYQVPFARAKCRCPTAGARAAYR